MFIITTDIKHVLLYIVGFIVTIFSIVFLWTYSYVSYESTENYTKVEIHYLLPMKNIEIKDHFIILPEMENSKIEYEYEWANPFKLQILFREKSVPKGQNIKVKMRKIPSKIFFIKKSKEFSFRFQAAPELLSIVPEENVNTKGNLYITFNTWIDPKSMKEHVKTSIGGQFRPVKENEKVDYSRWIFEAKSKLDYNQKYKIIFQKEIRSFSGQRMNKEVIKEFTTTKEPKVVYTQPKHKQNNIPLYSEIKVGFDQKILSGEIEIEGIKGKVEVLEKDLIFKPYDILMPNKTYKVTAKMISNFHEESKEIKFEFKTSSIEKEKIWLKLILNPKNNRIVVSKGNTIIKEFKVGVEEKSLEEGIYYLINFGKSLYGPNYKDYPVQWIQFEKEKYIQNVPKKYEKNLEELSTPNIIFIAEESMNWLKKNLKGEEMFIIYKREKE